MTDATPPSTTSQAHQALNKVKQATAALFRGFNHLVPAYSQTSYWISTRLWWLLHGTLFLLGALLIFGYSPWSAALAFRWIQHSLPENVKLTTTHVSGALFSTIHIKKFSLQTIEADVVIDDVELKWSPLAATLTRFVVPSLAARQLTIILNYDPTPTVTTVEDVAKRLPSTQFEFSKINLDTFVLIDTNSNKLLTFTDATAQAFFANDQLNIKQLKFNYQDTFAQHHINLKGKLSALSPYAIDVSFSDNLNSRLKQLPPLKLEGNIDGDFDTITAKFEAQNLKLKQPLRLSQGQLRFSLLQEILDINMEFDALDLHDLYAKAPRTAWQGQVSIRYDNLAPQSEAPWQFALQAENTLYGVWSENFLPVRSIDSQWSYTPNNDTLNVTQLLLKGHTGALTGYGNARLAAHQSQWEFNLNEMQLLPWLGDRLEQNINGKVKVTQQKANIQADLNLFAQNEQKLTAQLSYQDSYIQIQKLKLHMQHADLYANAEMSFHNNIWQIDAAGNMQNVDPAKFGPWVKGELNGTWRIQGQYAVDAQTLWDERNQGSLTLDIQNSSANALPLMLRGKLTRLQQTALGLDLSLDAQYGGNKLQTSGQMAKNDGTLSFQVDAPQLSEIPALQTQGDLTARGHIYGGWDTPQLEINLMSQTLQYKQWGQITALKLSGDIGLSYRNDAALRIKASAGYAGLQINFSSQGQFSAHQIQLTASGPRLNAALQFNGDWGAPQYWRGNINQLSVKQPVAIELENRVALAFDSNKWFIDQGSIRSEIAQVQWGVSSLDGDDLTSNGKISALNIDKLHQSLRAWGWLQDFPISSDLMFDGEWHIGHQALPYLRLHKTSGDLYYIIDPNTTDKEAVDNNKIAIGIQNFEAALQSKNDGNFDLHALLRAERLGSVQLSGGGHINSSNWLKSPIQAKLSGNLPALSNWQRLFPYGNTQITGAAQIKAQMTGTLMNPLIQGEFLAQQLTANSALLGIHLTNATMKGRFNSEEIVLDELLVPSGKGSAMIAARARWVEGKPELEAQFTLKQFEVLSRFDRKLIMSGNGSATLKHGDQSTPTRIEVLASLKAEEGEFILPERDSPSLGSDVLVLDSESSEQVQSQFYLGINIDVGDHLFIKGRGLQTQLGGAINVISTGGPIRLYGDITLKGGHYRAYRQDLVIEKGTLTFRGEANNPDLNIYGYRPNLDIKVGVNVTGPAISPQFALISDKPLSDVEKLQYLLTGASTGTDSSTSIAQQALFIRLAGNSNSVINQALDRTGLDEFNIATTDTEREAVLRLGKRLSDRLYAVFEYGQVNLQSSLILFYQLSQSLSLRLRSGWRSGIDLVNTYRFD